MDEQTRKDEGLKLRELAELPSRTVLDTKALAAALYVDPRTLRKMVERGELPPGVEWGGHKVWIAGKVLDFIERKADKALRDAERRALSHERAAS